MTAKRRANYAEAVAEASRAVAEARLNDPDEHFPYKLDHVRSLVEGNGPMGPDGPSDDRVTAEDFMSDRIALASNDMVEAQAAVLREPNARTRSAYDAAVDDLVAARRSHRRNRVDADGKPSSAIVAITDRPPRELVDGVRHRRVGE